MNFLKCRYGYTLIEVVVATAIFLIAVLAVSGILMQGYRAMGSAGRRSVTLHLTQEEMEAAIANSGFNPEDEDVEISRSPHQILVFGQSVSGTLVTVTRSYSGQSSGEVVYTYFIPDGSGED